MQILRLLVLGLSLGLFVPTGVAVADSSPSSSPDRIIMQSDDGRCFAAKSLPANEIPAAAEDPTTTRSLIQLPPATLLLLFAPGLALGYISMSLKMQVRRRGLANAPRQQQHCDLICLHPPKVEPADSIAVDPKSEVIE